MTASASLLAPSAIGDRQTNLESVSIVIEWENARLAEAERPLRMLTSLADQLEELTQATSREFEVVLLFNPEAVDEAMIETIIAHARPRDRWPVPLRLMPSGDLRYYEQKNRGVETSRGDIVILLDSDVEPERNWLRKLLEAFDDPEATVVCGSTYVDGSSFYDRSMALFWLFPLRPDKEEIIPTKMFWANNVAFRRNIIGENPFPDLQTFRGQAGALSKTLWKKGIPIMRHTGARCAHPAPNGISHFVNRAMCEGYDSGLRVLRKGRQGFVRSSLRTYRRRMGDATSRIAAGYRAVNFSRPGAVGAWGVALAYNTLYLTGYLLSAYGPNVVPRYFPIR